MTFTFATAPAHVVTDTAGNVVSGWRIDIYDSASGGTRITDIQDLDGNPLPGYVRTDTEGRYPFQRASEGNEILWADDGQSGHRWSLTANEVVLGIAGVRDDADAAAASAAAAEQAAQAAQEAAERITTESELVTALSGGGEILVSGTITLTQTMEITKPTTIVGGDFVVTSGVGFHVTSSDVALREMRISGGGTANGYDDTQRLIHAEGTQSAPLSNVRVHECQLYDSRANNIWLEWCVGASVTSNRIDHFLYSGVMLISCDGVVVDGNQISDSPLISPVVNVYGIAATDIADTESARCRNVTISGNRVHLIDWEAIDTHGGDGITITGNVVTASPRGIALVVGNASRSTSPENCVVSGNFVDGAGMRQSDREGISLFGLSAQRASATITGNVVRGYGSLIFTDNADRDQTYIGGNNVARIPWSAVTMNEFHAHSTWPPQYKLDGNTVHLRGAAYRNASGSAVIGTIPDADARPTELRMIGASKGGDTSATVGMIGIHPNGDIELFYSSGTSVNTAFFLFGTYEVD